MIAKLNGKLDSTGESWAVIDVGGVGYLVFCAGRTLAALPSPGAAISLEIETVVREDQFHLYGFLDAHEREWFRLLRKVQSVGAKMALAILGLLSPEDLSLAIAARDRGALTRVSGVGPKLADRLITELKDKAPVDGMAVAIGGGASGEHGTPPMNADRRAAMRSRRWSISAIDRAKRSARLRARREISATTPRSKR